MFENISISYLYNFYSYLFQKKRADFSIFFILTFIFSLLPYIIVWFSIINVNDENQRSFFGDGSIIALCSGILCSYFAILFDYKGEKEKKDNIIINLLLILFYIFLLLVFRGCQLNFNRSWDFIDCIGILSTFVLIITMFSAMYLNFRIKINYNDVEQFIEEKQRKKFERDALKKKKSKSGIDV
jgi:hypothetical protein